MEYEKNDDYFKDGRPYIQGMKHVIIGDSSSAIAAFQSGQVLTSNQAITNMTALEALKLDEDVDNLHGLLGRTHQQP